MKYSKILIWRENQPKSEPDADTLVIPVHQMGNWIRNGVILKHLFQYRESRLVTYRLSLMPEPFKISLVLWALSWNSSVIEDEIGDIERITIIRVLQHFFQYCRDLVIRPLFLREQTRRLNRLSRKGEKASQAKALDLSKASIYLRSDLCHGLVAGGSVSHTAGVLNNLHHFAGPPIFITSVLIPGLNNNIPTHEVLPDGSFRNFRELPSLSYNESLFKSSMKLLEGKKYSFIYQRYAAHNYTAISISNFFNIPLVSEYNGSEVWVNRNWGIPMKYERLADRIELTNLKLADLVVVVSRPILDELVERGINADKILVNPNGVDPEIYSPDVDGSEIRNQYNFGDKVVIGFIGTFGRWHGAEVLAEAFGRLLEKFPDYRSKVRLLMVGNGGTMPLVKENLAKYNVKDECSLTGIVPQAQGPKHLAACDILASPHIPNADGSPFFGSPTKLFEYMAIGKGIVASNLDQIGEVLEHKETAWMVKPGDAEDLMLGMKSLIDERALRDTLGQNAREVAVEKYSWKEHTRKIIEKLKERCPCR